MLTRRRFGALALAALSCLPLRRGFAQGRPECSFDGQIGGFIIEAAINADEESYFAVSLTAIVPADNRASDVDFTYLKVLRSFSAAGSSNSIAWTFQTDDGDSFMRPGEIAYYELLVDGRPIIDQDLRPDALVYNVPIDDATFDDLAVLEVVVRLTLGGTTYEWPVDGLGMNIAMLTARQHLDGLAADYRSYRCEPTKCLLTTVACRTVGLDDGCFELATVRRLRDGWLKAQPFGPAALDWYYATAPKILAAIPTAERQTLFRRFYAVHLIPAVLAERAGLHRLAFRWLEIGIGRLERRYLPRI